MICAEASRNRSSQRRLILSADRYGRLLPHQEEATRALSAWWKGEERNGAIVLPTGSGKSLTAAHFVVNEVVAAGGAVLWLSHRSELASQAIATLLRTSTTKTFSIGRFEAGAKKSQIACDVVVGSIPTLAFARRNALPNLTKLKRLQCDRKFALVVVDECHHMPAKSW